MGNATDPSKKKFYKKKKMTSYVAIANRPPLFSLSLSLSLLLPLLSPSLFFLCLNVKKFINTEILLWSLSLFSLRLQPYLSHSHFSWSLGFRYRRNSLCIFSLSFSHTHRRSEIRKQLKLQRYVFLAPYQNSGIFTNALTPICFASGFLFFVFVESSNSQF